MLVPNPQPNLNPSNRTSRRCKGVWYWGREGPSSMFKWVRWSVLLKGCVWFIPLGRASLAPFVPDNQCKPNLILKSLLNKFPTSISWISSVTCRRPESSSAPLRRGHSLEAGCREMRSLSAQPQSFQSVHYNFGPRVPSCLQLSTERKGEMKHFS